MSAPESRFFTELEQHLDRAARRGARYGRIAYAPRPSAPVLAAILIALAVVAGALALPRAGSDDAELGAPSPQVTPAPTPTISDDGYGCDGPVHPETLATYSVLSREPDRSRRFTAPDGISFLADPVRAREAFGHRFWLIPAATPPDCAQPLICLVTDFVSDAVQCGPVDRERSTGLLSRVDPDARAGDPNLIVFAAAPDGLEGRELSLPTDVSDVVAHVEDNILVGDVRVPEEQARMTAESLFEQRVP